MRIADYKTTKEYILAAEVPTKTRTYKPVSHQQLIDLTLNSIVSSGFTLDKEIYSSYNDGRVANGRYTISNVADGEMQLQIGWQNSYDKTASLKFAIGTQILVCSNGCVSGDYGAFRKKHMGSVEEFAPTAITEYIKQAGDAFRKMQIEREVLKQIELTKRDKAELLGRLFLEEELISTMQMNIIAKEIEAPTFDYGAPDSVWELYQYTTYAMKETHPRLWISDHIKAHNFFVNATGSVVTEMEIAEIIA
jgi:hypothetical protein